MTGYSLATAQMTPECQKHFKSERFATAEVLKIKDGRLCFLAFLLTNYSANTLADRVGRPLATPQIAAFAKDYKPFVSLLMQGTDLGLRQEALRENYKDQLDEAEAYTEPEIPRSKYLPIDKSKFPIRTEEDFPLRVDASPISADDPYLERVSETFLKHYWWMAILAFVLWLAIQKEFKTQIAWVYMA